MRKGACTIGNCTTSSSPAEVRGLKFVPGWNCSVRLIDVPGNCCSQRGVIQVIELQLIAAHGARGARIAKDRKGHVREQWNAVLKISRPARVSPPGNEV